MVSTDEMLKKESNTETVYYHYDGLGSVVALTNTNGNVVEKYTYDVYGLPSFKDYAGNILFTSAHDNRFLFTGREYQQAHRIYDYRNRAYSPDLGRFLQPDPMGFDAGDINIYRYCGNNPINRIDPSGEGFIGAAVGFVSGAITAGTAAWIHGGDTTAIVTSAVVGGLVGAAVGAIDVSEGIASNATIGAIAGGIGDVIGQLSTNGGDINAINPGEVVGAVVGGGVAGALGAFALGAEEVALFGEWEAFTNAAAFGAAPNILGPLIGEAIWNDNHPYSEPSFSYHKSGCE